MNLIDELFAIARALDAAGIEYAVCGGIAVGLHGWVRTTDDIDLLIRPADVARVLEVVRPLGFDMPAQPMTFGAGTDAERHVQRVSKLGADLLTLDLLLVDAAYEGLLEGRIAVRQPEATIQLVSREGLLKMKRMAGRPQDLVDIGHLERGDEN